MCLVVGFICKLILSNGYFLWKFYTCVTGEHSSGAMRDDGGQGQMASSVFTFISCLRVSIRTNDTYEPCIWVHATLGIQSFPEGEEFFLYPPPKVSNPSQSAREERS